MWKIVIQIVLLFNDGTRDDITFVPERPLIERREVCRAEADVLGHRIDALVENRQLRILRDPRFVGIIKGHVIVTDCWYAAVKLAQAN